MCAGYAHIPPRECTTVSVLLSVLSAHAQSVSPRRDWCAYCTLLRPGTESSYMLESNRLWRQRAPPYTRRVPHCAAGDVAEPPLLALLTPKRLRAHHMRKVSPNHTASHLSTRASEFRKGEGKREGVGEGVGEGEGGRGREGGREEVGLCCTRPLLYSHGDTHLASPLLPTSPLPLHFELDLPAHLATHSQYIHTSAHK